MKLTEILFNSNNKGLINQDLVKLTADTKIVLVSCLAFIRSSQKSSRNSH